MSKSDDTPKFGQVALEEHDTFVDAELDAVTGGALLVDYLRGSQQGDRKGGRYLGQL